MPLNYGAGEDSWESLEQQGDQTSQSYRRPTLNIHWKDWCWSWSCSILIIWCEQMTHWKSPWCWERSRVEGEEGIGGWDGWIASPMQWTWTWANVGRLWGAQRPGVLQSMGSQRVRHDWAIEQQQQMVSKLVFPISFPITGHYFLLETNKKLYGNHFLSSKLPARIHILSRWTFEKIINLKQW